jgi:hypothetical protein
VVIHAVEGLGYALLVAFCVLVWWPVALLVAGLILLLVAQTVDRRTRPIARRERGSQ